MMTPLKSAGRKYQMGEYLDATKNIMNTSACDISEFIRGLKNIIYMRPKKNNECQCI